MNFNFAMSSLVLLDQQRPECEINIVIGKSFVLHFFSPGPSAQVYAFCMSNVSSLVAVHPHAVGAFPEFRDLDKCASPRRLQVKRVH